MPYLGAANKTWTRIGYNKLTASSSSRFVLYRFYDKEEILLYVGKTFNLKTRVANHERGKDWWQYVANMTIEEFSSDKDLIEAEKKAIVEESPIYNVQYNHREDDIANDVEIGSALIEKVKQVDYSERQLSRSKDELSEILKIAAQSYTITEIAKFTSIARPTVYWYMNR